MKNLPLKTQLITFIVVTITISWIEAYFIATTEGGIENTTRAFALMWTPGLVGLVLSYLFGWKFKDIGFKIGNWRYYALSYAVPALTAALILLTLTLTGLGTFEISPRIIEKYGSTQKALFQILVTGTTLGVVAGFISGLGEEIGWRGFMHTKLMELKISHPFLITGIIWAVWHWPLILFSNYATSDNKFFSVAMFTMMITSASVFMGLIRTRSGSVFTAALFHGVHNLWIQGIYPAFLTKGPLDPYFGGESGILNALFYTVLAIIIYQKFLRQGRPAN